MHAFSRKDRKLIYLTCGPSKFLQSSWLFGGGWFWTSFQQEIKWREEEFLDKGCANSSCCVLCFQVDEDNQHRFLECLVTKKMWGAIKKWASLKEGGQDRCLWSFIFQSQDRKKSDGRDIVGLIWLYTTCNLWHYRNAIMFKGEVFNFEDLL